MRRKNQGQGRRHLRSRLAAGLAATVLLVLTIPLTLSSCIPPYTERPLADAFQSGQYRVDGHTLTYVEAGTKGQPLLIFVHGTPGNWQAFRRFLQMPALSRQFHMVAVNRPGFGLSDNVPIKPDLPTQARYLAPLLEIGQHAPRTIVVGHSLGGTIAYQLAADYPAQVGGILTIAANIDPHEGRPRWFNHLASLPVITWLVPADLARANVEIMPLAGDLKALTSRLQDITIPVTVIHGSNDQLVSIDNLTFVQQELRSADLEVIEQLDAGHFILWQQPDLVVGAILRLADRVAGGPPHHYHHHPQDAMIPP